MLVGILESKTTCFDKVTLCILTAVIDAVVRVVDVFVAVVVV